MTPLTGDHVKGTIGLNKITDFSVFEHCWKHLGQNTAYTTQ